MRWSNDSLLTRGTSFGVRKSYGRVQRHVRRSPWPNYTRKTSIWTNQLQRPPSAQCTVQGWTNRKVIRGDRNYRRLQEEVIKLTSKKLANPFIFAPKNNGSLCFCFNCRTLNVMPTAARTLFQNGHIHRFTGRRPPIFDSSRQHGTLESRNQWTGPRENCLTSHQDLHKFVHISFGLKNATATCRKGNERHTVDSRMEIGTSVLGRRRLFKNRPW